MCSDQISCHLGDPWCSEWTCCDTDLFFAARLEDQPGNNDLPPAAKKHPGCPAAKCRLVSCSYSYSIYSSRTSLCKNTSQRHFHQAQWKKFIEGTLLQNTFKITSWSVRVLNMWRQERNERSLFAAEDGSVSQHVHSLHHGSPRHDLVIIDNNFISAILYPCYYQ